MSSIEKAEDILKFVVCTSSVRAAINSEGIQGYIVSASRTTGAGEELSDTKWLEHWSDVIEFYKQCGQFEVRLTLYNAIETAEQQTPNTEWPANDYE